MIVDSYRYTVLGAPFFLLTWLAVYVGKGRHFSMSEWRTPLALCVSSVKQPLACYGRRTRVEP